MNIIERIKDAYENGEDYTIMQSDIIELNELSAKLRDLEEDNLRLETELSMLR